MKGRASRSKIISLGVVLSSNVTHEFRHTVTVIVWGFEGVLSNKPARREDDKVKSSSSTLEEMYPSMADLTVNTVKIDGSGWSKEMEPMVL